MNIETVKEVTSNNSYSAIIDGVELHNIKEDSRFYEAIQEWIEAGNTPDPEFTVEEIAAQKMKAIESAIQQELDNAAKVEGYDSIHTAVTYADESAVAQFQADGQSFRAWRSNVWAYAYATLADYQAGNIPEPTIEEIIAGIPARV